MSYPPTIMADTGCRQAHEAAGRTVQCIDCPFAACVLDVPLPLVVARGRAEEALALWAGGVTAREAAKALGVSKRTALRYYQQLTAQG